MKMSKVRKVVLLITPSREYTRGLLRGIAKYSRTQGFWAFYRPIDYREPKGKERLLPLLKAWEPDGILMREPHKIKDIIAMGIPAISCPYTRERIPGLTNIMTDHVSIGEMGAEHLLERGFQQFAYCGFDDWWWSRKRGEFFGKTAVEAGYPTYFYPQPRAKAKRTWDKELPIIADWLLTLPKPVGLMACNDDRGEWVIEACKIAGLNVPDEVAIVGVDNDPLICDLCNPPLSSIVLNVEKAGYEAAVHLDKMMAGEKVTNYEIHVQPTHVAIRQSTDVLAVEDAHVAAALRFIRQRSKTVIQVSNVVSASGLSRRALEKRFRSILGHSIHDEIRRTRVEQIIKMLAETAMPISDIAQALGFPDVAHISRYFSREKGISPLAYRKRYLRK
jgi:LacI family transcriptional regulator